MRPARDSCHGPAIIVGNDAFQSPMAVRFQVPPAVTRRPILGRCVRGGEGEPRDREDFCMVRLRAPGDARPGDGG